MKPLTRRLMAQVEEDLGTKLDWVAVDHFNTGHPHSHIIVRGRSLSSGTAKGRNPGNDRGKDLIIARDYITTGMRERAADLVSLDLGPRTDREIMEAGPSGPITLIGWWRTNGPAPAPPRSSLKRFPTCPWTVRWAPTARPGWIGT
ncbi:hypothetical protein [Rhodospirillum sp. A1_3_36]|uniref:hypothetical protein n=1 Tax=Rhodospirillum sp. A1_3_36 TaxID=3391666 RepID=UPI0039A40E65